MGARKSCEMCRLLANNLSPSKDRPNLSGKRGAFRGIFVADGAPLFGADEGGACQLQRKIAKIHKA
jgi:hypothetical protein